MLDIEPSIASLLKRAVRKLQDYFHFKDAPQVVLDVPKRHIFGDLTSNIALQIGRRIRHPAREIAHIMVDYIRGEIKAPPFNNMIQRVEVGAPAFINFFLKEDALYCILEKIRREKKNFGSNSMGQGKRLNIEFVSANPTGPLTIAHGRQAAFGDALASILQFSGYRVAREYYINDEGRQIDLLGGSIRARYLELIGRPLARMEDAYLGEYIKDIARGLHKKFKDKKDNAPLKFFADYGYRLIMRDIKRDLTAFGVKFNVWFSQKRLRTSGKITRALSILGAKGLTYRHEGALWLRSTQYGDEKDRVIIKSDGSFTYLAPDIAYHMDKYNRRFRRLIDTWGPDHHGYIPRIKAAIAGMGYDESLLSTIIIQLVTLYRGKTPIRMSTRAGSFITLREVVDEIGRDCARFFFLRRRRDSHLDFDLELAKKQSLDNPVYYIQYAHARICSILKFQRRELKIPKNIKLNLHLLKSREEFDVLRKLKAFPMIIRSSARGLEPYRLLEYLEDLARGFHSFYNKHRVVSDDLALTKARLLLAECIKIVIANGLRLLGVTAPAKM